ncbi:MAG: PH domain-containing protein [Alphaproteobacteria bacterium]|nr:PH domain-containing protein [Alphaproteobacteria bacterium]
MADKDTRAMRYVRRVLQPGETIVYTTRLHPVIYWRAVLLLIIAIILAAWAWKSVDNSSLALALWIAAAIFALLTLSSALRAFIRRASTELAVTDQRVIYKTGLLGRHTLEMARAKVESVTVDQTLSGRMSGYGTVTVRGVGSAFEPIRNIADPLTFRNYLTVG